MLKLPIREKVLKLIQLLEKALDDLGLVAKPLLCFSELGFEVIETSTAEVLHLHVLEPAPNPLVRIQIRGVAWQSLQMEAPGRPLGKKLLDCLSPVGRKPIPDDRQLPRNLSQNVSKKLRLLPLR